jgi:hypothetical protein
LKGAWFQPLQVYCDLLIAKFALKLNLCRYVVASQARDMAVVRGDGERRREAKRRTELYTQPWVDEAVMRYITRKTNAGQ